MPIYEFECDRCGNVFERGFKRAVVDPVRNCPLCGGVSRKILSAASFRFKGPGFYATDYKKTEGKVEEEK